MKFKSWAISTLLILLGITAQAMGPEAITVKDESSEFTVTIKNGTVSVLNSSKEKRRARLLTPDDMTITLFRDPETKQTISLKAVEPGGSARPRFEGRVADRESSFVGFELKFSLPGKGTKVLKHMPQLPSPGAAR